MDTLTGISKWIASNCDGEWERENQLRCRFESTSNPGWHVEVDLIGTKYELASFEMPTRQNDEDDWWFIRIADGKFVAAGDVDKLPRLLASFVAFVQTGDPDIVIRDIWSP